MRQEDSADAVGSLLDAGLVAALEQAPFGVVQLDAAGCIIAANATLHGLLGSPAGGLAGISLAALMVEADRAGFADPFRDMLAGGPPIKRLRRRLVGGGGRTIHLELDAMMLTGSADGHAVVHLQAHEIDDVIAREERLQLCEMALKHAVNSVVITDTTGRIEWVNEAFTQITGYKAEEAIGKTPAILKSGHLPDSYYKNLWERLRAGDNFYGVFVNRRKDGTLYHANQTIAPVLGGDGKPIRYISIQEDVTGEVVAEQRVLHNSLHDPLTGLPNRAHIIERGGMALGQASRDGTSVAMLVLTVSGVTTLNTTFGQAASDEMVCAVGDHLRHLVRKTDLLARISQEEFAVLLTRVAGMKEVLGLARQIVRRFRVPVRFGEHRIDLATGIGIALSKGGDMAVAELVRAAELAAMHAARQGGLHEISVYHPEMDAESRHGIELERDLRDAVENGQLMLHFQPQVEFAAGAVKSFEALVRWNRPGHGMVPPIDFIGVAEQAGLMVRLGTWVLTEAVRQAAIWAGSGTPVRVAVNVSVSQLEEPDFPDKVRMALKKFKLPPHLLELEITESVFAGDIKFVTKAIDSLLAIGCEVSIDDFGTGYSSLSYLQRFKVSRLKIDRCFVHDMMTSSDAAAIARAIVGLARELGMRVLAEGVETKEQAAAVRDLGCHEAQGWLYGKPAPAGTWALHSKPLSTN